MFTLARLFATPQVLKEPKVAPLPGVGFDPTEMMQEYGIARKQRDEPDAKHPQKIAA